MCLAVDVDFKFKIIKLLGEHILFDLPPPP